MSAPAPKSDNCLGISSSDKAFILFIKLFKYGLTELNLSELLEQIFITFFEVKNLFKLPKIEINAKVPLFETMKYFSLLNIST